MMSRKVLTIYEIGDGCLAVDLRTLVDVWVSPAAGLDVRCYTPKQNKNSSMRNEVCLCQIPDHKATAARLEPLSRY